MNRVARAAALVVGLAAAVYGIARLKGGWLGLPPRWATSDSAAIFADDSRIPPTPGVITMVGYIEPPFRGFRPGARDLTSVGMIVGGVSFIVTGVRSRRRPTATT